MMDRKIYAGLKAVAALNYPSVGWKGCVVSDTESYIFRYTCHSYYLISTNRIYGCCLTILVVWRKELTLEPEVIHFYSFPDLKRKQVFSRKSSKSFIVTISGTLGFVDSRSFRSKDCG
jgi:hypothetical protein